MDDLYLPTLWEPSNSQRVEETDRRRPESNHLLLTRIKATEGALAKAKLALGSGWVTDLPEKEIPPDQESIKGVTGSVSSRDIGLSTTGALGLRWNVSDQLYLPSQQAWEHQLTTKETR